MRALVIGPGPEPSMFSAMFVVVPVLIAAGFVFVIVTVVYRGVRLARRGVDPLTLQEDLATRALRSEALSPSRSKADRLTELDALRAAGRITDDEHAAARARILSD